MFALSFFCHSMIDLVLRLVLRHGMLFAAIGIVIGTGASWLAARLMMSLLFATSPTDRLNFCPDGRSSPDRCCCGLRNSRSEGNEN